MGRVVWCFQGQGKSRPRPQAGYFPDFTLYYLKGQWMNECIDPTPKSSHTFRMQRANTTGDPQNPKTLTIYWRVITCNFISVPCCNSPSVPHPKKYTHRISRNSWWKPIFCCGNWLDIFHFLIHFHPHEFKRGEEFFLGVCGRACLFYFHL